MGVAKGSNLITDVKLGTGQVDKLYLGSNVVWQKTAPVVIKALKFTSTNTQTLGVDGSTLGLVNPNFEYSTDNGSTWTTWNVSTTLSFGNGTDLYIRGSNTILARNGTNYVHFNFSTASPVYCSGNVMHLYDYTQDLTSFPVDSSSRGLKYMFANCTQLVTCPSLPATTLINNAYSHMFEGCTSLTTLPNLHAGTVSLAISCYVNMFNGCSLIKLSETQTGEYQYSYDVLGIYDSSYATGMFTNTGGTFTGTPAQNTTYYTSNTIIT